MGFFTFIIINEIYQYYFLFTQINTYYESYQERYIIYKLCTIVVVVKDNTDISVIRHTGDRIVTVETRRTITKTVRETWYYIIEFQFLQRTGVHKGIGVLITDLSVTN